MKKLVLTALATLTLHPGFAHASGHISDALGDLVNSAGSGHNNSGLRAPSYRPGRPEWNRPGDDNHPYRPNRGVVCYAEDTYSQVYEVTGRDPRTAQRSALNTCRQLSTSCRPVGCRHLL